MSMEKKVYCLIGERCKCIKFSSRNHIPDVQMVRDRLVEATKNDIVLQTMMNNKMLVLQKMDPDRNNKLCDIEDDDEIEDKSEINVLLFEKSSNITIEPHANVSFDVPKDVEIGVGETYAVDYKIIHTEPINFDSTTSLVQESSIDEEKDVFIHKKCEETENYDIAIPSTSNNHDMKSNSLENSINEKTKTVSKLKSGSIPYPASLPPLTYDLQCRLEIDGILKAQRYFIAFWGNYLWQTTSTKPSKQDYSNLASSIVAAYPQLAGGTTANNEIVKTQLSTWIRNHRAVLKKHIQKRDHEGKPITFASIEIPTSALKDSDIKNALKELEKKFVKHINASHVKRLLQITMSVRRQWIEKESTGIVDTVTKYPSLEHYEIMLFELLNIKSITEELLFNKTNSMIDKLMKYFSAEDSTEKTKAHIMEKLFHELRNKKSKKKYSILFTIKEVLSSTEHLKTNKEEAPRVVIYTSIEGEIAAAYIVADEAIRVIIPQPTVSKVIIGLLCAYYVWHLEYPTYYANVLEYVDHEILSTSLTSRSTAVAKFIRERDNALKALNSANGDTILSE